MLKKVVSGLSAAAMMTAALAGTGITASAWSPGGSMRDITTMDLVKDMGIGINLGNTYEAIRTDYSPDTQTAIDYERGWGSVEITQEIIQGYAAEGFKTLRIPVAWSNMMADDGQYKINEQYMERVTQVVDWALAEGMYVVINEHWDGGWIQLAPELPDETRAKYVSIWTQVAENFEDYGDHLIFEAQNEEFGRWYKYDRDSKGNIKKDSSGNPITKSVYTYDWTNSQMEAGGKQKAYDLCNEYNQLFVDTIRSTGGNNSQRHLLISGYITNFDYTCDPMFQMPNDPADRMAISVHYYSPDGFAMGGSKNWGTVAEYQALNKAMDMMEETFVSKGIPAIIGECCNGSKIHEKNDGEAREYMTAVCEAAYARNMCPVLWDITYADNGSESEHPDNQIYNRRTCKMQDQTFKEQLKAIVANNKQKGKITAPDKIDKTYKDPAFTISATAAGGGKITYSSSNEKVAKVDANGKVTIGESGMAKIYMYSPATDSYTAATAATTVNVGMLKDPPTTVEEYMTVDKNITKNTQIKLPAGWSWVRTVELEMDVPTKARAVYEDTNYVNRAVDVTITRTDKSALNPAKVVMNKASVSASAVRLKWKKADKAVGYEVYRGNTAGTKWTKIATVDANTLTYRDAKRSAAKVYKYKVRAIGKLSDGSAVYGKFSDIQSVLTRPKTTKVVKKAPASTSVKLKWKKVACTGYQVQKYDTAKKKWVTVKTIKKAKTVTCTVKKLKNNTKYKFRVRAYKKTSGLKSYSKWSKTVVVRTKK